MLRNILKRRLLFAMLIVSLLFGVAFLTTSSTCRRASAMAPDGFGYPRCYATTNTYYSDATYSTIIGQTVVPCYGDFWTWGSTSSFHTLDVDECGC